MKASTERKIIRWIHIILSVPVIGYIYGPVAQIPEAWSGFSFSRRLFYQGFILWKGHLFKKWYEPNTTQDQA